MKILSFILLMGSLSLSSCGGTSSQSKGSQVANSTDTINLGDLRDKFAGDSIFLTVVAPDLMLVDNQYFWAATESDALKKGLSTEYYKRVKKEVTETNELIKKGVMKGADIKRIPDFQKKTN